jgi:hypothetical protein
MQTVYVGNTLINDVMLGSQRMDDVIARLYPIIVEYVVVAGGGGGGTGASTGFSKSGGGGAGGLRSGSLTIQPNVTSVSLTVGGAGNGGIFVGGVNATNGGNSQFVTGALDVTCLGGGRGGRGNGQTGASGGSGGAGGGATGQAGGAGTAGEGFGGSAAPGQGGSARASGQSLEQSVNTGVVWLDGITYAEGGGGGFVSGETGGGSTSSARGSGGGAGATQGNGSNGVGGIIKLRYYGAPLASGGTITQSGGYTYHAFTASGTFTY